MLDRVRFIREELDELERAVITEDLADQADALIDLVYVAKGTAVAMGLPWYDLWQAVHEANLKKVPGINRKRKIGTGDAVKPLGWLPPDLLKILINHGYDYRDPYDLKIRTSR